MCVCVLFVPTDFSSLTGPLSVIIHALQHKLWQPLTLHRSAKHFARTPPYPFTPKKIKMTAVEFYRLKMNKRKR